MKRVSVAGTALLLFVFLGAAVSLYAGEQQGDKQGKPDKQAGADKQQGGKQQPQHGQGQQSQHAQVQQRAQVQQHTVQPHVQMRHTPDQLHAQQMDQRNTWQQHRARNWEVEHRTWQQRGGYQGQRLSTTYFRTYYGPSHWFRIYGLPFMVVQGYPRFQSHGYWFSFVDPYPEFWGANWYETDDVYVDYVGGGYYLYNSRFRGRPGVAISIVF